MAKPASVTAGLVTKKGEAIPSSGLNVSIVEPTKASKEKMAIYYKSLTVKLDRAHYEALKHAGIKYNRKSQDIFVEALELWLQAKINSSL